MIEVLCSFAVNPKPSPGVHSTISFLISLTLDYRSRRKQNTRVLVIASTSTPLVPVSAIQIDSLPVFDPSPVVFELSRWSYVQYCLLVLLLPMLAIPACITFGASDFFLHHGASVWVKANDAVFSMHNRDCDVLIFGDSTAMTGIDPDLLTALTGFRVCNIAVTNAVLAVTGTLTLDRFLAANAKPRILLFQLSPDGFEPSREAWHSTIYAEGMLEVLRHGDRAASRLLLLSHPRESAAFAGYAAGFGAWYVLRQAWFHVTHNRPEEDTILVRNGFFTPPGPARTSCTPLDTRVSLIGQQSSSFSRDLISSFQSRYAHQASVLLVNVAPIPACDGNLAAYQTELHGVTSNSLQALPITLFNDDRHYTANGSRVVSSAIAGELNTVANRTPALDDRLPVSQTVAMLHHIPPPSSYRQFGNKH